MELVVWDFDGVLSANRVGDRMVWAADLKRDLGLDLDEMQRTVFARPVVRDILRGRRDLLQVVSDWLAGQDTDLTGQALLDYWFAQDARPDAQVIGWLSAHPGRRVIGTNNEPRRAAYIRGPMGFGARVERVFASGEMGVAKPDQGFFAQIERWAGLAGPQILLVDDSLANVQAAQTRGWRGFHFTDATRTRLPGVLGIGP